DPAVVLLWLGCALAVVALGWQLWAPLDRTVQLLADAASPVALFTIGAVLARSQLQARVSESQARAARAGDAADVGLVTAAKLLLHPALVWGAGTVAVWAGVLTPAALAALVLVAALPSASNVSLLAERFGADNGRVARIILWTTALAFFSFAGVATWMKTMY
ncbi:MAG: AEC family transporter, partial [Pseudomonadota bacterium]|nr:AEC family transporter [Pseudomonadota bacterium]